MSSLYMLMCLMFVSIRSRSGCRRRTSITRNVAEDYLPLFI